MNSKWKTTLIGALIITMLAGAGGIYHVAADPGTNGETSTEAVAETNAGLPAEPPAEAANGSAGTTSVTEQQQTAAAEDIKMDLAARMNRLPCISIGKLQRLP